MTYRIGRVSAQGNQGGTMRKCRYDFVVDGETVESVYGVETAKATREYLRYVKQLAVSVVAFRYWV